MKKLKCETCGANIEFDDNLTIGFCKYCGTKYMLEEKININVKLDNKNENKINMANEYIENGNYEKAEKIFKNVLEDDITNHKAWWGRYICEKYYSSYYNYRDKYGNTSAKIKASIIKDNLKLAYNAIANAPEDYKRNYQEAIKIDENYLRSIK